jgi:hypothetical protein
MLLETGIEYFEKTTLFLLLFEKIQNSVRLCVDIRGHYRMWVGKKVFIAVFGKKFGFASIV